MPTTINLQWHKGTKRWRKKIDGKDFYFKTSDNKSDMDGYRQAWQQYQDLLKTIQAKDTPTARQGRRIASNLQKKSKFYDLTGDPVTALEHRMEAEAVTRSVEDGTYTQAEDFVNTSPWARDAQHDWNTRLEAVKQLSGPADSRAMSELVKQFLVLKKAQATTKKITVARYSFLKTCLKYAVEFLHDPPATAIDETTVEKMYTALVGWDRSIDYQENVFSIFKQFVRWGQQRRLIRADILNLNSKDWKFATKGATRKRKKKVMFEKSEIDMILDVAKERLQLCVLLALNCGFTQVDISDLDGDDVNWQKGTITRKRSKTENYDGVPMVTWTLWPKTFALLKKLGKRRGTVLTTAKGTPFRVEAFRTRDDGYSRKDVIGREFRRLFKSAGFKKKYPDASIAKPFKSFRKTGNSILMASEFADVKRFYLCQASRQIDERHYDVGSVAFQERFDKAIAHIGKTLGFVA